MADLPETSTALGDATEIHAQLKKARDELELIYSLDRKLDAATHGHAKLTRLIGELTRHLGTSYTVLLVPSKSIRISVTHADWKTVDRKRLDDKMMRRLFARYSSETTPILLQLPERPKGAKGNVGPYQLMMSTIRDDNEDALGVLATFCQTENKPLTASAQRLIEHVTRRARRIVVDSYDALTGLVKSRDFVSIMSSCIAEAEAEEQGHCLVYFDVDKLQLINDTFDYRAGDEVLVRFAKLLQDAAPTGSVVARISGDNFAVLMRYRDQEAGVEFANSIRARTTELVYLRGDKTLPVSVSAGVVDLTDTLLEAEGPLVAARVACTKAKDHGRDRVECYDVEDKSIIRRVDNLQLVGFLQTAMSEGNFTLDAQPIVALTSSDDNPHFEILLRMTGQQGEALLPTQFFETAEHYQLMPKLDRLVLTRFFETAEQFVHVPEIQNAGFSLNLSGQSLGDPSFHEFVRKLLQNSRLRPNQICFEITETAAVANRELAINFMLMMKELGCLFALDDFGAGLSSFAYLRDFPVDKLKIDGSFVHDIDSNKISESMVAAIAQVAKVMGLKTVAEYVETAAVRDRLLQMGVDYGQGFLLGRPAPLQSQLEKLSGQTVANVVSFTDALEARGTLGNN